jgi:hypothetical protein
MNPKKKSRRYRVSVSIQALDLAISRFTNSLALKYLHEKDDGQFTKYVVSTKFSHNFPQENIK